MKALAWMFVGVTAAITLPGCLFVPKSQWNVAQAENHALKEQNRAQLTEIENLKVHGRTLENRVIRSEEQLALLQDRAKIDRNQLDAYQQERDGLYDQFEGMA